MLNSFDIAELNCSGIDDETIAKMGCRSISVKEAVDLGFRALAPDEKGPLLTDNFVSGCLFFQFKDIDGNDITEDFDRHIGVIKPRYTEHAQSCYPKGLPKYLCPPSSHQERMHIHFPIYDWESFKKESKPKLYITEGIKKAQAACSRGFPTTAVWSTWCFCENGIDSPLIRELKDLINKYDPEIYVVFDSDKYWKDGVFKAELALIEKIFLETGKEAKVIDLPSVVGDTPTKGFDDYLLSSSNADFMKLVNKARTPFSPIIQSKKQFSVPKAPFHAMPDLMGDILQDIQTKYEGCHEMAAMSLLTSVAVTMRNKICIEKKRANLYMIGIAETVSGKSTVARAALDPLNKIDSQLLMEYLRGDQPEGELQNPPLFTENKENNNDQEENGF